MTVMHSVGEAGGPSHPGVILGFGCRLAMFSRRTRPLYYGIVQVFEGTWGPNTRPESGFLCPLHEVHLFWFYHAGFLLVLCPPKEY